MAASTSAMAPKVIVVVPAQVVDIKTIDLRDGGINSVPTPISHIVSTSETQSSRDDDLPPVTAKWCLSNLTNQELETEITRARAFDVKWSEQYKEFESKIRIEQERVQQARNDQTLTPAAVHAIVMIATSEIDRLNNLFIEHKKACYPYSSTAHLLWVKEIREHNDANAHLSCCRRYL